LLNQLNFELGWRTRRRWNVRWFGIIWPAAGCRSSQSYQDVHDDRHDVQRRLAAVPAQQVGTGIRQFGARAVDSCYR